MGNEYLAFGGRALAAGAPRRRVVDHVSSLQLIHLFLIVLIEERREGGKYKIKFTAQSK